MHTCIPAVVHIWRMSGADDPGALARLEAVLKPIMWRNSKASVGNELLLPERTLEVAPCKLLKTRSSIANTNHCISFTRISALMPPSCDAVV